MSRFIRLRTNPKGKLGNFYERLNTKHGSNFDLFERQKLGRLPTGCFYFPSGQLE